MYTGTLIEELMETVERAEQRSVAAQSRDERLERFYAFAQIELAQYESNLAGVA